MLVRGTLLCLKSHLHFKRALYCWERGRPRPQTVVSAILNKKANAVRATRSMRARAPAFPALASLLHKKIPFLGKAAAVTFELPSHLQNVQRYTGRGRVIPNFRIRLFSVVRFKPRRAAAPAVPPITQPVWRKTFMMCSRSTTSSKVEPLV